MSLLKKLRKMVAPKVLFEDRIHVHTTDSGTQYIPAHAVFSDKESMEEMRQLNAMVRAVQGQEQASDSDRKR